MSETNSNYLTIDEFTKLKRLAPWELMAWLRSVAIRSLAGVDGLDDDEKSDAFTGRLYQFFSALKRADTPGAICSFVVQGTRWDAMDILKRKRLRAAREVPLKTLVEDDSDEEQSIGPWELRLCLDRLARSERAREIDGLLANLQQRLTDRQKLLLRLTILEQLDRQTIAVRLKMTVGAVSTAQTRLYGILREVGRSWRRAEERWDGKNER